MKIDNQHFKQNLIECQATGILNKYLVDAFITICDGVSKIVYVKRMHDLEDLKQSAMLDILAVWNTKTGGVSKSML